MTTAGITSKLEHGNNAVRTTKATPYVPDAFMTSIVMFVLIKPWYCINGGK